MKTCIKLAVFMITLLLVSAIGLGESGQDPNQVPVEKNPNQLRIERQIAQLRTETVEEGLKRLNEWEYYNKGWVCASIKDSRAEFLVCAAAEGVQKLLAELRQLPKKTASKLIDDELAKALEVYKEAYQYLFRRNKELRIEYLAGRSPVRGHAIKHCDEVTGAKWKVLALLLLAGNLELEGEMKSIRAVVEYHDQQSKEIEQIEDQFKGKLKRRMLVFSVSFGIASRYAIPTALLASGIIDEKKYFPQAESADANSMPEENSDTAMLLKYNTIRQTSWDVESTLLDQVWYGRPDYSKGEIIIRYVDKINEQIFMRMIKDYLGREDIDWSAELQVRRH